MEWILIAGALCLSSHQDLCIRQSEGTLGEHYAVAIPGRSKPERLYDLKDAKSAGERIAKELDEFTPQMTVTCSGCGVPLEGGRAIPAPMFDGYVATQPTDIHGNVTCCLMSPPTTYPSGAPYGMTKEEFGKFIRDQVREAAKDAFWGGLK